MVQFILILGLVSLLLDWYVFQGFKQLTGNWRTKSYRKGLYRLYWVLFIAFLLGFGLSIYLRFAKELSTPFTKWFINAFITLLVTKLAFSLVLLLEDLWRGVAAMSRFISSKSGEAEQELVPGRRLFISQLALVGASIPFASFVYGIVKGKYDFTIHRQTLYFEDLPDAFDGFTITQISDIHSGSFDDMAAVRRGVEMVKALQSDLFVFTGDLVNDHASEIVPYMDLFGSIQAPHGQYSILGNHDYGLYAEWPSEEARKENLQRLKQHHAAMGYRLLLDEHVQIEKDGQRMTLLGVENWGTGFIQKGDLNKAMKGVEAGAFKILLSHDPSHWDEIVKVHPTQVHLTLSGHTHGMQFGVETPLVRWSPARYRYENWAGLARHNNRLLYVNRGFGFIGFSGRVGIWPEITVLELRKHSAM